MAFQAESTDEPHENEDIRAIKRLYELTIRIRDFEITQLSQRNNFFMIFQGVLFTGLATLYQNERSILFIAFVGIIASFFQIGISSGAKYWQEYWEEAVKETEEELIRLMATKGQETRDKLYRIFSISMDEVEAKVKDRLTRSKTNIIIKTLVSRKFSVSRIPIYTAITFFLLWLGLFIINCFIFSSDHILILWI